jgi:hypothetical protein
MEKMNKTMYYTSKTSVHLVTDVTPVTDRIFQGKILSYGDRVVERKFAKSTLFNDVDEAFNKFKNKMI